MPILSPAALAGRGGAGDGAELQSAFDRGRGIYAEVCVACHGEDGRGTPHPAAGPGGATMAPSLATPRG